MAASKDVIKNLETKRDYAALLALLDPNEFVVTRRLAAHALATVASYKITPQLAHYLSTDCDRGVRQTLAQLLGRLADDRALPALINALKDPELMVREDAALALSRYNSQAAFEILLQALQDKSDNRSWLVRRAAAQALGQLADPRAVPALIEALRDPHELVRPAVAEALGLLGDRKAIVVLERIRHVGRHQAGAECAECIAINTALKELRKRGI